MVENAKLWKYWHRAIIAAPLVLVVAMWAMFGAGVNVGKADQRRALVSFPAVCAWSDPPSGVALCPERP